MATPRFQKTCYYTCGHKGVFYLENRDEPVLPRCAECGEGEIVMIAEPVGLFVEGDTSSGAGRFPVR